MEESDPIEESLLEEPKKSHKKLWIIIGILAILAGGYLIYTIFYITPVDPANTTNMSFGQFVCSQVQTIPTWVNEYGVVDNGVANFEYGPKTAVDLLINAKVFFVYHSDCMECKDQIGYFGQEWGRYVESGFTIDCKYV